MLAGCLVLVAVVAAGCGGQAADAPMSVASPDEEATRACAIPDGQEVPADCAPHDLADSMAANDAYRQRSDLTGENRSIAEAELERIRGVLEQAIATTDRPLTSDDVFAHLGGMGYGDVQAYDLPGVVTVGVSTLGGCVHGSVRGTEVTLKTGTIIADGGCLAAPGH